MSEVEQGGRFRKGLEFDEEGKLPEGFGDGLELMSLCWHGKARSRDMLDLVEIKVNDLKSTYLDGGLLALANLDDDAFAAAVDEISDIPVVASWTTCEEIADTDETWGSRVLKRSELGVLRILKGACEQKGNTFLQSMPDRRYLSVAKVGDAVNEKRE